MFTYCPAKLSGISPDSWPMRMKEYSSRFKRDSLLDPHVQFSSRIDLVDNSSFSNSLIIQKPKTKEIMHRDVFGYLMKNSCFCILNFPFKISLSEKLYQTLVTVLHHNIKNLEVLQKYSATRRIFNSLLGV